MKDVKERLVELSRGVYVERDVLHIAERIAEYDSNLRLKFLNDPASLTDAPYALFELCKDGIERKVFDIWELNEKVLEQVYAADTQKVDVLEMIKKANDRAERDRIRRYEDRRDADRDLIEHVVRSPKGRYSFENQQGEVVQIDDDPARKYTKRERRRNKNKS